MSERKLRNLLVKYGLSKDGAKALAFALTRHGYDDTADAVRKETERIAKTMCEQCSQGIPLEDGGRFHHPVSDAHVAPRYLRRCDAAGIRAQPATAS